MMTPDAAAEFTAALFIMRSSKKNKVQERREALNCRVGSMNGGREGGKWEDAS
jgi:hypothetical protein